MHDADFWEVHNPFPEPIITPDYIRHAAPSPGPDRDITEPPTLCYKIALTYIPFLIAALDYWCYPTEFTGSDVERDLAVARMETLRVILMTGNIVCVEDTMYLLRQSPLDPCVLEQSTDNGLTWTTAFDYGLCRGLANPPTLIELTAIASATATATAELVLQYDDTPESIWPDAEFESNERDAYREDAMCYAISILLATLEETIKAQSKHNIDWRDVAQLTASVLKVTSAIVLAANQVGLVNIDPRIQFGCYVVGILSTLVGEWLESVGDEPDLTPLLDSGTQQELLCCAMEKCRGATPSIGVFASLFDGCAVGETNADVVWMLSNLTENAGVYLNFLDFVRAGFDAIDAGQAVACGCDEGWEVDIDCTLPTLPGYLDVVYGTHVPGTGINVVDRYSGGVELREAVLKMNPTLSGFSLTNVLMEYANVVYGGGSSAISTIIFEGNRDDPPAYYLAKAWTRAEVAAGDGTKLDDVAISLALFVQVLLNVSYGSYAGGGTIVRIRMRGDGENPFV